MNVRVKQKRTWRNTVLRSDRVSSRLLGAKLKRSAVAKQWKSSVRSQPVSPGLNCGSLTPVLGVMSYTTPVFGSWNTIRPCGVAELPLASPVPGTGKLAGPYSAEPTCFCLRSEARSVGDECVSTVRYRGSPSHLKKNET